MYFEDLSVYTYSSFFRPTANSSNRNVRALNVGWLDEQYPFPQGEVAAEFITRLFSWCERPTNLYRGHHTCQFCRRQAAVRSACDIVLPNGNGEIHVFASNDVVFVAPTLIGHYVAAHQYLPPPEFILAINARMPSSAVKRANRVRRLGTDEE